MRVIANGGEAAPVILLPLRALFGLQAVLVLDAHEPAIGDEHLEELRDALAQPSPVVGEVFDKKIGEEWCGRPQPSLAAQGATRNL